MTKTLLITGASTGIGAATARAAAQAGWNVALLARSKNTLADLCLLYTSPSPRDA